jgi:nicotinate phosphoribosyltransferase
MTDDVISTSDDHQPGEPLLKPVMRNGQRLSASTSLADIRERAACGLAELPEALRDTRQSSSFPVAIAPKLTALADEVDRFIAAHDGSR